MSGEPVFPIASAPLLDLRRADCMEVLRGLPDGVFDLAIVDPPYGISAPKMRLDDVYSRKRKLGRNNPLSQGAGKLKNRVLQTMSTEWDEFPPGPEYFVELRRVARHQIIWGGNYFDLPPTRGVICWDKEQPWENFSQWEMAWTSFDRPAALFRRNNSVQERGKIHPTQKPVKLYEWLLARYAERGWRILDTHMGSGSLAIACHYRGHALTACELDEGYYAAAVARIERETRQLVLPGMAEMAEGLSEGGMG